MTKSKLIYLLYSYEGETNENLTLLCASTSSRKIKNAVINKIRLQQMEYGTSEYSIEKQLKDFEDDWKHLTRREINRCLIFGFLDTTEDGMLI